MATGHDLQPISPSKSSKPHSKLRSLLGSVDAVIQSPTLLISSPNESGELSSPSLEYLGHSFDSEFEDSSRMKQIMNSHIPGYAFPKATFGHLSRNDTRPANEKAGVHIRRLRQPDNTTVLVEVCIT
jgi:hypothetical protein